MTTGGTYGSQDEMIVISGQDEITPPVEQTSTSQENKGEPQKPAAKTYSEEEVTAIVNTKTSELSTKIKTYEKDRSDALAELGRLKKEHEAVQAQLDDLTKDKPEAKEAIERLNKRLKGLDEKERAIEADKLTHQERVKWAENVQRKELSKTIAAEFTNGDPLKLEQLVAMANATTEEQIRKIASTIWTLKSAEPAKPTPPAKPAPPIPDSGVIQGGNSKLTNEQIENMPFEEYRNHPSVKARYK